MAADSRSEPRRSDAEDWMDAPMSPLTDEQAKALAARQVADTRWQPNEVCLTRDDSLLMHGETATQAMDEIDRLRKWIDTEGRNCPSKATIDAVLGGSPDA